ncbi:MAG: PQQ-binding-like beta-propeller repeat protein [Verrucomicrobia bacterium]|nr:PQQ-binding-like beta-propeller repeat protein [Verrucomicrobiota bacterium]
MKLPVSLSLCLLAVTLPGNAAENLNWPEFRGPGGSGYSSSTQMPLTWSETNGVAWKTPIHGRAWSSPVVWNDQIWITTATEDGQQLSAVAVHRETGKVLHDRVLFTVEKPQFAHKFNSYGSPTPAVEEGRVYLTFGSPGIACLDTKTGGTLWERRDFVCNHYRGAGSSPILDAERLYLNFDGSDRQYVVALDKKTGRTVWETPRSIDFKDLGPDGKPEAEGDWRKAYATGTLARLNGVEQLLSQGAKAMYSYDPRTGAELWRVEERTSHSGGTRPAVGLGLVFVPTGWSQGQVLAIRPGKSGEVLDANEPTPAGSPMEIVWRSKRGVPKKPALLLLNELLFAIDDSGIATCWDAKTGTVIWNERVGGNYSASPVAAGERIYVCSEEGKTTVLAASRTFAKLAENQLEDGFMATPALSGDSLILRTKSALYRIGR